MQTKSGARRFLDVPETRWPGIKVVLQDCDKEEPAAARAILRQAREIKEKFDMVLSAVPVAGNVTGGNFGLFGKDEANPAIHRCRSRRQ